MSSRLVFVLCVGTFVPLAQPASAQRTTGQVVGTVTDDTGAVLPNVAVSLRGDAIMGVQGSTSNDKGYYRFVALPPGAYTLSFRMAGFGILNRQNVRVGVGGTTEENAALEVSPLSEEITVSADAAVVDTQSNQLSTNYDKGWVRNAPGRRFSFFDLIAAAPGVSRRHVAGFLDHGQLLPARRHGLHLAFQRFVGLPWPNTDAIEEIEVLSLGAPAEYGNVQGAVFNVVTRQGANSFHGDANVYYQNQGLTGRNTTDEEDGGQPYHRDRYHDASFQLSGPIVRDKLWFFGSFQYQRDFESAAGTPPEFPARFETERVFFKLNYQLNPRHKVMFAYHDDYYRIPERASALTAPTTLSLASGHNPSPNVTYTAVLSNRTYVEARYSGFYGVDHGDPLEEGSPGVQPRYFDLDSGAITGGIYSWWDGDVWKSAVSAKVSHFADTFLGGSHDFKFGVQYNTGGSDQIVGPNDFIYTYGTVPAYGYTQLPWHHGGQMRSLGTWVDDSFRLGSRLTINAGLRFDHSVARFESFPILDREGRETGQFSPAIDSLFTWNSLSPRIGFNAKLNADGKTLLKAHYGRYYRGIVTGEFAAVTPALTPRFLFSGLYDAQGNPLDTELVYDNANLRVDPGFQNPYTDQFVVGIERELFRNVGVSATFTHKRGRDYGGWRDTGGQYVEVEFLDDEGAEATGRPITVFRLTNSPDDRLFLLTNPEQMFSRYNGLVLQVRKAMANRWQMVSSLVLGKSEGRLGSSLDGPGSAQFATAGAFGANPNDYVNSDGLLIGDRPLAFKTQLVYELPAGFLVGANFTLQSGRPWGRQVRPARSVTGLSSIILAERIDGSRRVARQDLLDLRVQKEFKLGGAANVALFADVLNALNDDAFLGVQSRVATSSSFGRPSGFIFPRRMMVGAKLRF